MNLYDVRRKCDRSKDKDGPLCYKQLGWVETWMNNPKIKAAPGVDPSRKFESCNMEINQAIMYQGDDLHNSAMLLPKLTGHRVRLLVYTGNAGNELCYVAAAPSLTTLHSRIYRYDV